MLRILGTDVHVHTDDGTVVYHAGDAVKSEHVKLITNPHVWEDGGKETSEPTESTTNEQPNGDPGSGSDVTVPPQAGHGSGKDAWLAYAKAVGFEVDADATKDAIISALKAEGIAVTTAK